MRQIACGLPSVRHDTAAFLREDVGRTQHMMTMRQAAGLFCACEHLFRVEEETPFRVLQSRVWSGEPGGGQLLHAGQLGHQGAEVLRAQARCKVARQ